MTRRRYPLGAGTLVAAVLAVVMAQGSDLSAVCPECIQNYVAFPGHGAAPDGSGRRIVKVRIDPSWDDSPGQTNSRIWNAVSGAVSELNNATDGSGNKSGYYLQVDQGSSGDIAIKKETCASGGGFACFNTSPGNWASVFLAPENVTTPTIRDDDLKGRIGHEMLHTLGVAGVANCSIASMSHGTYTNPSTSYYGQRTYNSPTGYDIQSLNEALMTPGNCTGSYGAGMSEESVDGQATDSGEYETQQDEIVDYEWVCTVHYLQTDYYYWRPDGWHYWYSTWDYLYTSSCYPLPN